MENRNEMEIDLLGLILHLKTKIWIILLVTLVFGIGGFVSTKVTDVPVYTASTQVYVRQLSEEGMNPNNLTVSTQIRRDCAVIIRGESVTREVVQKMQLPMSPKALGSAISVTSDDNTRILKLSYSDTDPKRAAAVLNCVCEVAADQVEKLMDTDTLVTLYEATVPTVAAATSIRRNTVASAAIGCVLTMIIIVVIFLLDDTIRSEDDVESYLGLSTLASVPTSSELRVARVSRGGKRKKSGEKPSQTQKR